MEENIIQAQYAQELLEDLLQCNCRDVLNNLGHKLQKKKNNKPGLWANIHARRKAGKRRLRPGEKGYPKTLDIGEDESCTYEEDLKGDK